MKKLVVGVCILVELGCLVGLAAIGLKRNEDYYKAEMKLLEREADLMFANLDIMRKEAEIKELNKELAEFKGEEEEA